MRASGQCHCVIPVRIQYEGSVTPGTAALLGADSVDGFLAGGASRDAGQFAAIVLAGT